jgi:Raf kinase inhibitor-like YbhB/YbcL family protein
VEGRVFAFSIVAALLAAPLSAQSVQPILVTSPTMNTGEMMPRDYSPDGRNLSPPIEWQGLPEGTQQIAVICQDHGAGFPPPWVHWIIYNIPGSATGLPEGIPFDPALPVPTEIAGATQGNNGWGLPMYRGPAPPVGNLHHYHFVVYALDQALDLPPGLTRVELLKAIEGHVIGQGDMVPMYERIPMAGPTPDGIEPS